MRAATPFFLLLTLVTSGTAHAHDFTWDNLLMVKMKLELGFSYQLYVDSYMKLYRPNVWKRYRNDEFELEDRRRETIAIMKQRAERFPVNEPFTLYTTVRIGDYDFSQSRFPIAEAAGRSYWYTTRYPSYDFPVRLNVFFKNPEIFGAISMERSVAKAFINRRKNEYGQINRRVDVTIQFRIVELKNYRGEFYGEIESVRFFEDDKRTRLFYTVKREEGEKLAQE